MKTKTTLRIFQVGMVILILLMSWMVYIIVDQQELLNKSTKTTDTLKETNKQLETELENAKSYRPLDVYEYTSSSNTETFEEVSTDGCSYWFVYYTNQPSDGLDWSNFIKQDTPYFSYEQFKKQLPEDKVVITGRFIKGLTKVSKETYEANVEIYK
jgi:hypothetical protein